METTITVRGGHETRIAPERATAVLTVAVDGPDRSEVVAAAGAVATEIGVDVAGLLDPDRGPVVAWSSDRISVWTDQPVDDRGRRLPEVHRAAVGLRARFSDFDELAAWIDRVAARPEVRVDDVRWELTDATRTSITAEVRSRAVRDAVDKATVYAHSIGLSAVSAVAIADPGMLGDPASAPDPSPRFAMVADTSASPLGFTPEDIVVQASVDARFAAR